MADPALSRDIGVQSSLFSGSVKCLLETFLVWSTLFFLRQVDEVVSVEIADTFEL